MAQLQRQTSASPTTSSAQIVSSVGGGIRRKAFAIINTHATSVVTIGFGDVAVVAGAGIVLQPLQGYIESTNEGFECWQGTIQAIASAAATVAVNERLETDSY